MSTKKSVVVSAVVHAKAEYTFHFEFDGNPSDEDAMKAAAWNALNSDAMLGPLECLDHEFVDEEQHNTAMELEVVDGLPNDYRPAPKQLSEAKLWRKATELAGRFVFPPVGVSSVDLHIGQRGRWSSLSSMQTLVRKLRDRGRNKAASRLEAALAAWKAAK